MEEQIINILIRLQDAALAHEQYRAADTLDAAIATVITKSEAIDLTRISGFQ